jgi:hypothetical protein
MAQAANLKIRELDPGPDAHPTAEYVELQMPESGQGGIEGQALRFYDPSGSEASSYVIPSDVTNDQSQRTVLLATEAAEDELAIPAPDFTLPEADRMDPSAGAVCFTGAAVPDCATWGAFPIFGIFESFPDPQSANAEAISAGMALRRSIAPGCPTYLDAPDDSGDSAGDFSQVAPGPRSNYSAIAEAPCPPDTAIQTFPQNPTGATTAAFTYSALGAGETGDSFKCSLDDPIIIDFTSCSATGISYSDPLPDGSHTFRVFATGPGGPDPTPASYTWTVDTQAPETAIDSTPAEPSNGFSTTFTFHSSEENSTFRCQLDEGSYQFCFGSKTYINLLTGSHAFRVYAVDNASNEDLTPAEHSFTVDNSIDDETPPDTTILSHPPDPSSSDGASFTYAATEPGANFQCRLDNGAFASCSAAGISYSSLRNGSHIFAARAVDRAGNTDRVPATYGWTVAAPLPEVRIVKAPSGQTTIKGPHVRKLTVTFKFTSSKPGSSFRCRMDKQAFHLCSPTTRLRASVGRHRFEVFAIDALGNEGIVKARRIFRVQKRRGGGLF